MFRVHIETDNDAFHPDPSHALSAMLRDLAKRLDDEGAPIVTTRYTFRDTNGNGIGFALFVPDDGEG